MIKVSTPLQRAYLCPNDERWHISAEVIEWLGEHVDVATLNRPDLIRWYMTMTSSTMNYDHVVFVFADELKDLATIFKLTWGGS